MLTSYSMIRRDTPSADRTREILGLPDAIEWSHIEVRFGLDEPGDIIVHLIPSGEQVRDLAQLSIQPLGDDCVVPTDMPDEDQLGSALTAVADTRPHSRACGMAIHPHGSQCAVDCPTCHM